MLFIRFSTNGLYDFGFTCNFSSSSRASKPSIILPVSKKNRIQNIFQCIHKKCRLYDSLPNRVYFKSRCGCAAYVKKNWHWFVFGPELAIETIPRSVCLRFSLNSSSNFRSQIELPPLPVPVGSPVWTMNPLIFRWNRHPL